MKVTLLGLGCGSAGTLTAEAARALGEAQYILGARRLLDALAALPEPPQCPMSEAVRPQAILERLEQANCDAACVVYSGDSGFYSGARALLPLLRERGYDAALLPGISSLQALAARLGRPWQDWTLVSAHGVSCDPLAALGAGRPAFFLTGGSLGPAQLCRQLTQAGLGGLGVTVGENLTYPDERILSGTAAQFSQREFAPLSVMLAEAAPTPPRRTPGWPDEAFVRSESGVKPVPMTKQEVRAAILSKLAVTPDDVCWDIGAGTGSVSVELAAQCRAVWAVECRPEACALIEQNSARFHTYNLNLVCGRAPEVLAGLPAPDAVFVGGSEGRLAEILQAVRAANPAARICVSAIALETLTAACAAFEGLGCGYEVSQISVSRTRCVGRLHLLMAQNPVFLISTVQEEGL